MIKKIKNSTILITEEQIFGHAFIKLTDKHKPKKLLFFPEMK